MQTRLVVALVPTTNLGKKFRKDCISKWTQPLANRSNSEWKHRKRVFSGRHRYNPSNQIGVVCPTTLIAAEAVVETKK